MTVCFVELQFVQSSSGVNAASMRALLLLGCMWWSTDVEPSPRPVPYSRMDWLRLCRGRQPSSLSISAFFPQSGFLCLRPVITVLPAERDSRDGSLDVLAPLSPTLSMSAFPFDRPPLTPHPQKPSRPPAPIIQRLPPDGPAW